jgi:CheY-like chemotaxis protein
MKTQAFGSSVPEGGRWKTGNQRTVLYVDDNPKAVRMLKFVIEGSGYKVVAARDAGEALERMQQSGCDLVPVNYRMLNMIGSDPLSASVLVLLPS